MPRIVGLLALWFVLALLRGPACPWGWGMAVEGVVVAVAAARGGHAMDSTSQLVLGRSLGPVLVALALATIEWWVAPSSLALRA